MCDWLKYSSWSTFSNLSEFVSICSKCLQPLQLITVTAVKKAAGVVWCFIGSSSNGLQWSLIMFIVKRNCINWIEDELRLLSYRLLALERAYSWDSLVIQFVELGSPLLLAAFRIFPSFPDTMEASNISNLKSLLANTLAQTSSLRSRFLQVVKCWNIHTQSRSLGSHDFVICFE